MSFKLIKSVAGDTNAFPVFAMPTASEIEVMAGLEVAPAPRRHALDHTAPHEPGVDPETEARERAAMLLDDAQQRAAAIEREAQQRAATIEREAQQRIEAEVAARVAAEVAAAAGPLREQLAATVDEVANVYGALVERAEQDVLRLALEIARKVIRREVAVDPEIAVTLVRVALGRLHNRAVATVRLHPDDIAYVTARLGRAPIGGSVDFIEDASVGQGGCLVHTEMGDVDARIEQQVAEIERALLG